MTLARSERWTWIVAHPVRGRLGAFAAALVGYVALARLGYQLVSASGGMASFWPPNGWIVALLVLAPKRLRLWVIAAVLPGELLADSLQGYAIWTALGWGAANVVEVALATWILLTLARRRPQGDTWRDLFAVATAAFAAPLVGGLVGASISVASFGGHYGAAWLDWWIGDATGIMLVAILVLSFAWPDRPRTLVQRLGGYVEVGLVIGAMTAVCTLTKLPLLFLILPPLVLLAVRHGLRLTALASVSYAVVATICTGKGLGPLSNFAGAQSRDLALQAFITTTSFVAFLICGTMSERRRVEDELFRAQAELRHQATHDALTGLPSRALIVDRVEQMLARARRMEGEASLLFVDLDGFKEVNDRYGHLAGDEVLRQVAGRLKAVVRAGDTVGRLGGDEFIILLDGRNGVESTRAELTAERVLDVLRQPFVLDGPTTVSFGASIGIATGPSATPWQLLRDADQALYAAKDAGRGRYAIFEPGMEEADEHPLARAAIESPAAREALRASELRLRELFERAPYAIYTSDLSGRFTSVNLAAEQITGFGRDELLTMSLLDLVAPEAREHAQEVMTKITRGGDVSEEIPLVSKDGRSVFVELTGRLRDSDGGPEVEGTATDTTERHILEDQLLRQSALAR